MSFPIMVEPPPLVEGRDGVIHVVGTRVPLERVIRAFLAGATPEQIVQDFDVLRLEDVYAVVSYFLRHRSEVETYLKRSSEESGELRAAWAAEASAASLRERFLSNRSV